MSTVFISYRQTSDTQRQRVREFGERLRDCGINVVLDQFFLDTNPGGPDDGWDKWSSDRALKTEYVLIIGTEDWFECFEKSQPPGTGLGAACEADDLRHRIYKAGGTIPNIRIVLFDNADAAFIPPKLERYHRFHAERDFANIARWLGGTVPEAASYTRDSTPRTSIPNNLPRQQFFFGRADELKRIAESLSPDSRGWGALIDGPGGIGKTALAIRAAELVPGGRFKRIIFLSSKERELTADGQRALGQFVLPSYLEMLNAIAREIERPDLTKSPETERSDSILRALRESDVLLVLDNLETLPEPDRDQLFAFLNRLPRGCSGIVTSRRRADASAIVVRLDKLDWPAARDLLLGIAQDIERLRATPESDWRALYDETGGNPLLMRWVAGQLGLGRCKTIPDAVERLREPAAQNNPLEFIFGDLLDTFTANETKVLAALAHFTSQVAANFIAELAGINTTAAHGALSDLSSRALVLSDLEERNFALVPMVAEYLRRKKPEVVQETGDRLEKHAYALAVENGFLAYDHFPVLDAAWPTVAAALPRFLARENSRLQTVCGALQMFLEFTGRWDEWLALSREAESRAVAEGDFKSAGYRAYDGGSIHFLRGQNAEVLASADRAEDHWSAAQAGARERSFALQLRGHGHRMARDYAAAIAAFRDAVTLSRTDPYSRGSCGTLSELANAERLAGDFDSSERDYREALRIARAINDGEAIAVITSRLSQLALDRKNWPTAEALAREALLLAEKVGRLAAISTTCLALATALVRQGKRVEALPHARRAVEIHQRLGMRDLAEAQQILAECESSENGSD